MEFGKLIPKFRHMPNGEPVLADTSLVGKVKPSYGVCDSHPVVHRKAIEAVKSLGGDINNQQHLLGQYTIQFGRYRGKSFIWMVENCLGYAGYLVDDLLFHKETQTTAPLSVNKFKFKEYVLLFMEGRQAVDLKKQQRLKKKTNPLGTASSVHGLFPPDQARRIRRQQATMGQPTIKPIIPNKSKSCVISSSPSKSGGMSDDALLAEVLKTELNRTVVTLGKTEPLKESTLPHVSSRLSSIVSPTPVISPTTPANKVTMKSLLPTSKPAPKAATSSRDTVTTIADTAISHTSPANKVTTKSLLPTSKPAPKAATSSQDTVTTIADTAISHTTPANKVTMKSLLPTSKPAPKAATSSQDTVTTIADTAISHTSPANKVTMKSLLPTSKPAPKAATSSQDTVTTIADTAISHTSPANKVTMKSLLPTSKPAPKAATSSQDTVTTIADTAISHTSPANKVTMKSLLPTSKPAPKAATSSQDTVTTIADTAKSITSSSNSNESSVVSSTTLNQPIPEVNIPDSWKSSLPNIDQQWIGKALFSLNSKGRPEINDQKLDRLWFEPPQPQPNHKPRLDRYFGHMLLVWMPQRMWKMALMCPHCKVTQLTKQGPYRLTRMVLDLDGFYILASENLHCSRCKKNQISWSPAILDQLDPGTRSKFPVQILYHTACDNRVIFLLHQRTLGNSPTQLQKSIVELHNTSWTNRLMQYMTDCKHFKTAASNRLINAVDFEEPPKQQPVPTYQWFIRVYCQEVKSRSEEVKASITSTFGNVLKMDSTKQITKKLAGVAARTAAWCTDIGNEYGQVLQCVMTATEGVGLEPLVKGIINRYADAKVQPPCLLYVDCHCCGKSPLTDLFISAWPDLCVRLDAWHYMRRFAVGVTTDTHRLYPDFMAELSAAIFMLDKTDYELLMEAKRNELLNAHFPNPTPKDVKERIDRKEIQLHCRRSTRGTAVTTERIKAVLESFDSEYGKDTMGIPLLHHERIWEIWRVQQTHVGCLQDPMDVQLYTQVGTLKKGGIVLPKYRCARGSTSLESFHNHLKRFIPGTSANANNFQAYLLEGLMRWNEDRAAAAVSLETGSVLYDFKLKNAANKLSMEMYQRPVFPNFQPPSAYTGELIGIDYLYSQTGRPLASTVEGENTSTSSVVEDIPNQDEQEPDIDEGFQEEDDDPTVFDNELAIGTYNEDDMQPKVSRQQKSPATDTSPAQTENPLVAVTHGQSVDSGPTTVASSTTDETNVTETPEEIEDADGPDNVAGYGYVAALAEFLVKLNDKEVKVISTTEANKIVQLWNGMVDYDRLPTSFKDRFQTQLIKGRFKAPKTTRTTLIPGVQSVKRCSLAPHLGPATWPDSNRYQQAIISKLCIANPGSTTKDGVQQPRWKLVLEGYSTIREMVFSNKHIQDETSIQLPEINQRTLQAWFSARGKKRERTTIKQGLNLQGEPTVASSSLPKPVKKPVTLEKGATAPIEFTIKDNTSGQLLKCRTKRQLFTPILPAPSFPATLSLPVIPPVKPTPTCLQSQLGDTNIPYSTKHNRKRRLEAEQAGNAKRGYVKKTNVISCGLCGQDRKSEGHTQFYGKRYCPTKTGMSQKDWEKDLRDQGFGQRKK